jgi:hypothetical protein
LTEHTRDLKIKKNKKNGFLKFRIDKDQGNEKSSKNTTMDFKKLNNTLSVFNRIIYRERLHRIMCVATSINYSIKIFNS